MGKARKKKQQLGDQLLEDNRKARFDYLIEDEIEAGVVLRGSEVKSIREGNVSLKEAFCQFRQGELYLIQAHVAEWTQAHARNHEPLRARKLLLHRRELGRLEESVQTKGLSIVPLALYVKERRIKLLIGLGRGKKLHDKRAAIKAREQKREMKEALGQ